MEIENIDVKLPNSEMTSSSSIGGELDLGVECSSPITDEAPESENQESSNDISQSEISTDVVNPGEEISAPVEVPLSTQSDALSESEIQETSADAPVDGTPLEEEIIEDDIRRSPNEPICITEEQLKAMLLDSSKPVLDKITSLSSQLLDLSSKVSSLRKLADMHEGIENDLNNQINSYKDNFYRRIVNPILVEIFDIQECMNADIANASEETAKLLIDYVEMLTKALQHYGVTVEKVSIGDTYNAKIHKPTKAVPTTDATLDKTVARTRKTLIHYIDGQLVERAPVQVYQFTETTSAKVDVE